jgi:plasmid stabilization system protein ParE
MSGYAFHPDAFADLDEIWEYIAQDNVDAADRVLADIHSTVTLLAGSPQIDSQFAREELLPPKRLELSQPVDSRVSVGAVHVVAHFVDEVLHRGRAFRLLYILQHSIE